MNDKQSKSNLADDVRKIAKAFVISQIVSRTHQEDEIIKSALSIAESLPGKIEVLEAWGAEQSCNAKILRLKLESIESGDSEIGLRAQAQDAIDQQIMRAEAAESQLARVTADRDEWRTCAEEKIALLQREVDAHRKRIETSNFFEGMWRSAEKETIELESQLAARDAVITNLENELLAHEGEVAQGKKPSEYMRGFIEGLKRSVAALAAASAFRHAQPASGLADDARKIAKALRFYAHATGGKTDALALAESLPNKIEALEMDAANARRELAACDAKVRGLRHKLAEAELATVTKERDEAYARGVEDAAKAALAEELTGNPPLGWPDEATNIVKATVRATKQSIADAIRALLHKTPATNATQEKESDDDLQAAESIRFHQNRELDK